MYFEKIKRELTLKILLQIFYLIFNHYYKVDQSFGTWGLHTQLINYFFSDFAQPSYTTVQYPEQ